MTFRIPFLLSLAALGMIAQSQSSNQAKQPAGKQDQSAQQAPAPLFGGQIGTRSSTNTKESATLGFNGIDPSGKVQKSMLSASPGSRDVERVRTMETTRPSQAELKVFLKEGGLKAK